MGWLSGGAGLEQGAVMALAGCLCLRGQDLGPQIWELMAASARSSSGGGGGEMEAEVDARTMAQCAGRRGKAGSAEPGVGAACVGEGRLQALLAAGGEG